MAFVKVKGRGVADVADARCGPHLSCFFPNEAKGTFVAGRGYTSYYDRPKLVCWTGPTPIAAAHDTPRPPSAA